MFAHALRSAGGLTIASCSSPYVDFRNRSMNSPLSTTGSGRPPTGAWSGWIWTFPTKEEHATSTTVMARDRIVMARSIVRAVELLRPGDEVYIRAWKVRPMSMSIGEELRDARIARGLTVEQVSAVTKISPAIVRGIGPDDLQRAHGGGLTRSF